MATTEPFLSLLLPRATYNMNSAGFALPPTISMTISALATLALYNVIELLVLIFLFFRQRRGLYFYSFCISTFGIIPYTVSLLLKFFQLLPPGQVGNWVLVFWIIVGWSTMVTGQSVILYSRLHLMCADRRKVRWVGYLIVANFCVSNIPIAILVCGANSRHPERFATPYAVYERLQLSLYFVQEAIISALYVYETSRMLQLRTPLMASNGSASTFRTTNTRDIMRHLLWINLFIIFLDVTLVALEYIGHYELQVMYKAAVYSVKLKLEFRILNQLVDIAKEGQRRCVANFTAASEALGKSDQSESFAWSPRGTLSSSVNADVEMGAADVRTGGFSFGSDEEVRRPSLTQMSPHTTGSRLKILEERRLSTVKESSASTEIEKDIVKKTSESLNQVSPEFEKTIAERPSRGRSVSFRPPVKVYRRNTLS